MLTLSPLYRASRGGWGDTPWVANGLVALALATCTRTRPGARLCFSQLPPAVGQECQQRLFGFAPWYAREEGARACR